MINKEMVNKFKRHQNDTGSSEIQIIEITNKIDLLTEHFKLYSKDFSSRRGLEKLISKRRKLLEYVKKNDLALYKKLVDNLDLRK